MTSVDKVPAAQLHQERPRHLGRQVDTAGGWRTIRDIRRCPDPGAAVIIELVADQYEAFAVWPEAGVRVRDDGLEVGNCFGVYTAGAVVETHRLREHAHLALVDREPGSSVVVVVCPVHPHYLAEECRECGPGDLLAVLAAEDRVDDDLLDAERRTCHHCKVWALDDEHLSTPGHRAAVERTAARVLARRALPHAA
ncbi:hypothetical protein [Micromonospora maritima]|uniref:hypothetical protein n=1 Tax=Micromonospora maritima TaxID=986711 RepID=UPI00157CCF29|nr:hypothetical protein [Micromonospora maritima]